MQAPVCRDCFAGTLRGDVTPSGTEQTLHGIPTYVASPDPGTEPIGTVVILTDAFGWTLQNTRALADAYARRVPCTVYVPDFMDGHAIPTSTMPILEAKPPATATGLSFLASQLSLTLRQLTLIPLVLTFLHRTRESVVRPRILAFLRAVRSSNTPSSQPTKLAVAGFCWGGQHAMRLAHDNPDTRVTMDGSTESQSHPLIDCAFVAHPSLLSVPSDIEKVVQPVSLANGDDDQYLPRAKMVQVTRILEWMNTESGREGGVHEVVVYPGAKHGFAVRGDLGDPLQKERGEGSEGQAVRWFQRHFAG